MEKDFAEIYDFITLPKARAVQYLTRTIKLEISLVKVILRMEEFVAWQ